MEKINKVVKKKKEIKEKKIKMDYDDLMEEGERGGNE